MDKIKLIAHRVRDELEKKYGDFLYGTCIEASERLVELLKQANIKSQIIEGWCEYNTNFSGCSDRPYDEHTWVEIQTKDKNLYLDVTATQFQNFIEEDIPKILLGIKPDYMVYEEPWCEEF